jgi:hypothetical protein
MLIIYYFVLAGNFQQVSQAAVLDEGHEAGREEDEEEQ